MSELPLELLYERLGYRFKNSGLLTQALTHKSMGPSHNQRLEFLGDAILDLVVAEWLYSNYPDAQEGPLSDMRASMVNGRALVVVAQELGLQQWLQQGHAMKHNQQNSTGILADAVEAIIAALYLDGGLPVAQHAIKTWFAPLYPPSIPHDQQEKAANSIGRKDAKSTLQELMHRQQKKLPIYRMIHRQGKAHQPIFTVSCEADQKTVQATGRSRRIAEQRAAQLWLKHYD